jgi:hypothetical protein
VKDFEVLHDRVAEACAGIDGLGDLTRYDVALRIGIHLGKLPQRVYLHAGTRKGAKALDLPHRRATLEMSDLPPELRRLRPWQAEDFLCIYKDEFEGI